MRDLGEIVGDWLLILLALCVSLLGVVLSVVVVVAFPVGLAAVAFALARWIWLHS